MNARGTELRALLVAPNRGLAEQFANSIARTRAFDVVGDLKAYPSVAVLEAKLRQLQPEVLLLDVATSLETAAELIRQAASMHPPVQVIGLHTHNDSQAILRSLRYGAAEFLYAPFEVSIQEAAISRIQRLIQPDYGEREAGRVIMFASAKPGSGASTLATQTAFAIRRATGKRVLLADFDLVGGAISFFLRLEHTHSVLDLLQNYDRIDQTLWNSATIDAGGVDVLPAPETPHVDSVDPVKLQGLIQFARTIYDWVVVDLPTVFDRTSLLAMAEADRAFLVSTTDLASLHLARRAVKMLSQLGVDSQRYQVLVNRMDKRDQVSGSDLGKLFECRVDTSLPNDTLSVQRVVTLGQPVDADSELGRALDTLVGKMMGAVPERKAPSVMPMHRPAYIQV